MKITLDLLKALNACSQGVELFAKHFPDGITWGREGWLAILQTPCYQHIGWVGRTLKLHPPDLYGADLSKMDFRDADFCGATLTGVNLRFTNLRGADLSKAYLTGADFADADLSHVDLTWVNFQ